VGPLTKKLKRFAISAGCPQSSEGTDVGDYRRKRPRLEILRGRVEMDRRAGREVKRAARLRERTPAT
jgi:hypothetical protein